jgi:hypothetical protein
MRLTKGEKDIAARCIERDFVFAMMMRTWKEVKRRITAARAIWRASKMSNDYDFRAREWGVPKRPLFVADVIATRNPHWLRQTQGLWRTLRCEACGIEVVAFIESYAQAQEMMAKVRQSYRERFNVEMGDMLVLCPECLNVEEAKRQKDNPQRHVIHVLPDRPAEVTKRFEDIAGNN